MKNLPLPLLGACFLGASALSAPAALLVYEGFNYSNVGDELIGKGGTTEVGLNGTWNDASPTSGTTNDMFLKSGSLGFSNLSSSGNHIGFSSNANSDRYHRTMTTTGFAQPTIYFSFLFEKLQNNFGADHEGFALMNGIIPAARWDGSNNPGAIGRHGFAIAATNNSNFRAVGYDGTTGARVVGTNEIAISVVNGGGNTSTSNVSVNMIVGEISFNTGTGGTDVFRIYSVADDGSLDAGDLTLIDTIEVNVDETALSTLNLTRQVNVNWDEVRIGTTLNDVIPVPEPKAAMLGALGAFLLLRRRK